MTPEIYVDLAVLEGSDFESSNIDIVGYIRDDKTLVIKFRSGHAVYLYEDVEESTYNLFVGDASLGQFYVKLIQGKYAYSRLDSALIFRNDESEDVEPPEFKNYHVEWIGWLESVLTGGEETMIGPFEYVVNASDDEDAIAAFYETAHNIYDSALSVKVIKVARYFD